MQRLFSMFPAGLPGLALLCLRLAATVPILQSAPSQSSTLMWLSAILAFSTSVGFLTPVSAVLCCAAEAYLFIHDNGAAVICAGASTVISFALLLLGPGAYSVDARLFGRKSVIFKTPDEPDGKS